MISSLHFADYVEGYRVAIQYPSFQSPLIIKPWFNSKAMFSFLIACCLRSRCEGPSPQSHLRPRSNLKHESQKLRMKSTDKELVFLMKMRMHQVTVNCLPPDFFLHEDSSILFKLLFGGILSVTEVQPT